MTGDSSMKEYKFKTLFLIRLKISDCSNPFQYSKYFVFTVLTSRMSSFQKAANFYLFLQEIHLEALAVDFRT